MRAEERLGLLLPALQQQQRRQQQQQPPGGGGVGNGGGVGVCRCVLQVHDELVYEVSAEYASAVAVELTAAMEGCVELCVPLLVSTKTGPTLGDLTCHDELLVSGTLST